MWYVWKEWGCRTFHFVVIDPIHSLTFVDIRCHINKFHQLCHAKRRTISSNPGVPQKLKRTLAQLQLTSHTEIPTYIFTVHIYNSVYLFHSNTIKYIYMYIHIPFEIISTYRIYSLLYSCRLVSLKFFLEPR